MAKAAGFDNSALAPDAASADVAPRTHVLGQRVAAFLIDTVLVWAICIPVFLAVARSGPPGTTATPAGNPISGAHAVVQFTLGGRERYLTGGPAAMFMLGCLVIFVLVFALAGARWGATPGMRLLGLRVVGQDGGAVGIGRHLARTALWVVDGFPYVVPGGLAFLCALCNPNRQRIGDLAARTLVVARGR